MAASEVESPVPESGEARNKAVVDSLYKAIAQGKMEVVGKLVANDLEWWFHGPPKCQHMMRTLTGKVSHNAFRFEPRSVEGIGDCVIVEGCEGAKVYWVHVWRIKEGVITQFREYFNTWLTVKDIRPHEIRHNDNNINIGNTLWQSHPRDLFNRSLPGLLLAI